MYSGIIIEHEKIASQTISCNSFIDRKPFFMSNSLKIAVVGKKKTKSKNHFPKVVYARSTLRNSEGFVTANNSEIT